MSAPPGWSRSAWAAIGVFAAGLLLVEVNVFSRRHYVRWDWSATQSYTLSESTKSVLKELKGPTTVTTLLGAGTPHRLELATLLESYASLAPELVVQRIDPDRQPAEYLALTRSLSSFEGAKAGGLSLPAAVVERGDRRAVIQQADLGTTDPDGRAVSRVELALTRALVQVSSSDSPVACFVTGHGEPSVEDVAPAGLRELGELLESSQVDVRRMPMDVPRPAESLETCTLIAVVGPERALPDDHVAVLAERTEAGTALLLALDPILDRQARVVSSNLDSLAKQVGVVLEPSFVIETDPQLRAPNGLGEAFFAVTKSHPITEGLSTDQARLDARAFFVGATALRPLPGAGTVRLLETSASADTLSDLRLRASPAELEPPFSLGLASEKTRPTRDGTQRQRAVVLGSSNVLINETLSDSAQIGNRILAEQALSWLLERDALVSVPTRTRASAGLRLTEEALSSLLRYVLFVLPSAAAAIGAWVLWRRRRQQDKGRRVGRGP